jgi:hypothetical protein
MDAKTSDIIISGESLAECLFEMVREAIRARRTGISEGAEFYIVELLKKFHHADALESCINLNSEEKPMTILLLEALQSSFEERIKKLRTLGDSALILAGFFEENLKAGTVDPTYYFSLGKSAYSNLSGLCSDDEYFAGLFFEMSEKFPLIAEVLSDVAPWNHALQPQDIIRLYERWLKTGDLKIRSALIEEGLDLS